MGVGITVEFSPEDIAKGIKKMDKKDMETLLLIMSGEAKIFWSETIFLIILGE